ncbi:hypothetical protein [Actinopolyspora mortivallis]|uniref:B3/B4 tRNA-binding domain-containing protein n=1 Tax=Actinopolyspora mortivallis TaxID=33906 RepID=A0A2T0GXG5_ACTMO|nr:hypothetical protein [Actinopolyspora mortivallis]PRW63815.1 hypothetical protein CEP50_08520 [Actinopolyspora mortivallis]
MFVRAELSEQARSRYPGIRLAAVSCENLDEEFSRRIKSLAEGVHTVLEEHLEEIDTTIASFEDFFGEAEHSCPLRNQLSTTRRKGLPPAPSLVRALLYAEMTTGVLMGVHDAARIDGEIVLDTADAHERFEGMSSPITCTAHEPVLRDGTGVIASLFQGPDKRTQVGGNTTAPVFSVFAPPRLSDERFVAAIDTVRRVLPPNTEVTVCDEVPSTPKPNS